MTFFVVANLRFSGNLLHRLAEWQSRPVSSGLEMIICACVAAPACRSIERTTLFAGAICPHHTRATASPNLILLQNRGLSGGPRRLLFCLVIEGKAA